jgi:hypothetical protein
MTNREGPSRVAATALGHWLGGFGLGLLVGALGLLVPTLGLVLAIAAGVLFLRARPRLWATAGLLIGAGASWIVLFWRAMSSCRHIETPTYSADCRPPDIGPYLDVANGLLVAGTVILLAAFVLAWRSRLSAGR